LGVGVEGLGFGVWGLGWRPRVFGSGGRDRLQTALVEHLEAIASSPLRPPSSLSLPEPSQRGNRER
jgi:hypothetical protein